MRIVRPTTSESIDRCRAIAHPARALSTVVYRTFLHHSGSNQADDVRCCTSQGGQSAATEVSDGLSLVVADSVFHRGIRGSAGYGADVHGGFSPRSIASDQADKDSVVGRVLTQKVLLADEGPDDCIGVRSLAKKSPDTGLFFWVTRNTLSTTTPIQRQPRMDRIARPGRDISPVIAEPT